MLWTSALGLCVFLDLCLAWLHQEYQESANRNYQTLSNFEQLVRENLKSCNNHKLSTSQHAMASFSETQSS